jgi:hypothetical protein
MYLDMVVSQVDAVFGNGGFIWMWRIQQPIPPARLVRFVDMFFFFFLLSVWDCVIFWSDWTDF